MLNFYSVNAADIRNTRVEARMPQSCRNLVWLDLMLSQLCDYNLVLGVAGKLVPISLIICFAGGGHSLATAPAAIRNPLVRILGGLLLRTWHPFLEIRAAIQTAFDGVQQFGSR
jgi:hypothetical protein